MENGVKTRCPYLVKMLIEMRRWTDRQGSHKILGLVGLSRGARHRRRGGKELRRQLAFLESSVKLELFVSVRPKSWFQHRNPRGDLFDEKNLSPDGFIEIHDDVLLLATCLFTEGTKDTRTKVL